MENKEHIFNEAYEKCREGLILLCNHDPYSCQHSVQVAKVAFAFGQKLHLDDEQLSKLVQAALLHDVGKKDIELEILNKPGKLTEEEFERMSEHAKFTGDYIRGAGFDDEIAEIAEQHHEKETGKGYPYGYIGQDRNYLSKIIQIADVYDALMSKRSYKDKMEPERVYGILAENAADYDSLLLKKFIVEMSPLEYEDLKNEAETLMYGIKDDKDIPLEKLISDKTKHYKNEAMFKGSTVMDYVAKLDGKTYERLNLEDIVNFRIALDKIMMSKELFLEVNPQSIKSEDKSNKKEEKPIREARVKLGAFEFGFRIAEDVRSNENHFYSKLLKKFCLGTGGGTKRSEMPFGDAGHTH